MIGTNKAVGNYLVDGSGNSLYWFTKDSANTSACSGDCIKNWPAFTVDSFVVPSALKASDFGTISRSDGTMQATYKGYPLYYWVKDKMHGDVTGQNVGKVWFVIDPEKFPTKM
jgi:predicted lipoprotein with Yx(FWY)xxD motif